MSSNTALQRTVMLEQFSEKLLDKSARCKQQFNIYSHRFINETFIPYSKGTF